MDKQEKSLNFSYEEIKKQIANSDTLLSDLDSDTLRGLMDYETDMLCINEGDVELISDCADILDERENDIISHDEFMAVVRTTLGKRTERKHFGLKRALVAAAAVAVLLAGGAAVAAAFGFSVFDYVNKIAREQTGSTLEISGATIENGGETKFYATIEEAMEKENLDIMYPTSFPKGVELKRISVANSTIGDRMILILTKNDEITISINTNVTPSDDITIDNELYHNNGITYAVFYDEENYHYYAYCNTNNNGYTIQSPKREYLIYTIQNMKEN